MVEIKKKEYKYIFGPVPSRRLGVSLGVDLMPYKTCTLDCVYCESGKTTELTHERKEYVPVDAVLAELDEFLSDSPKLDFITFSGSGEPTLHSGIGRVIRHIRNHYPTRRIALLTNSTLFSDQGLRRDLEDADLVIASVDAVSGDIFKKINRPHREIRLDEMLAGLAEFRKVFAGELWLEFFVIPGVNDHLSELEKIKHLFDAIRFDRIQINTLDRPGTESWVEPLEKAALEKMQAFFSHRAELIKKADAHTGESRCGLDPADAILSTIRRRPVTLEDIVDTLGVERETASTVLDGLLAKECVERKEMRRGVFYLPKEPVS